MPQPRLTEHQTTQALNAYITAREQAVRYVLAALDPTAFDAPALPYPEVLARVYDLIATEMSHYAEEPAEMSPDQSPGQAETPSPPTTAEDAVHG